MKNILKLITLLSLSSSFAFGISIPNSSTINKDIKVPKNIQKNEKGLIELDNIKKYLPAMIGDKSGKTIFVKEFSFTGNTQFTDSQLKNLLEKYLNKELSFNSLKNATTVITKYYRDKGYLVARAYLPVQKMENAVVSIAIIEGTFGKFKLNNNSLVKDKVVQNIFNELKKEKIISSLTLERAMLIVNDTPDIIVTKADIKPGEKVGESDFEIETSSTNSYDGYILLDNHGSRYTGENRVMGGLNINSPFKIGDELSLIALLSRKTDLKYGHIVYDALLHPSGLKGGVEYSYSNYQLGKEYQDLDATGSSKVVALNLSYPIIRQRDNSLYTTLKLSNKKNTDDEAVTDSNTQKELNVLTTGLEYDLNTYTDAFPTQYNIKAEYTYGDLSFKDEVSLNQDKAGADTQGNYSKVYLELQQVVRMTNNLSLDTKFSYQHSLDNKNLDGSEDFSISGASGVRVYPSTEASGENGYIFSIEPQYTLPSFYGISNTLGVFYDRAKVYMANSSNVDSQDIDLQDIGISYYSTYKDFFLNSYIAWKLNSDTITSEDDYNSKFLAQVGWVF